MSETAKNILVVGGANMDICGRPAEKLSARESNPGRVTLSSGGVGRNMAHDLALLGLPPRFLTALGNDANGLSLRRELESLGVDLSPSLLSENDATTTYLYITDERGEMQLAVCDMSLCGKVTPALLMSRREALENASLILTDSNFPEETLRYLAETAAEKGIPLFADPVSAAKAPRLKPFLPLIHTLKPNAAEAAVLLGLPEHAVGPENAAEAAACLVNEGVKQVFLSLGKDGVVFASADTPPTRLQSYAPVNNGTTGCGDAFMAALVWAHLKCLPIGEAAKAGIAAASLAMETASAINPAFSEALLMARMAALSE